MNPAVFGSLPDALSRLTSAGGALGTVGYQYDLAGRQTRITWPDAFYAAYEYDVAGALVAVRENGAASGAGVLALVVYDDLGRRASLTRGNGVVTTYAYDSASRLDVLAHNLSGTGSDVTLDFAHNSAGQISSRDRTSSNASYIYPQPGMNQDVYASNGLNQIASLDGASLSYDARGNLTNAGGVSYTYDSFNRLTAAGPLALVYDPAGRLYETTASGTTTRFLYAGLQAIGEYNTSGALLRRYVPGVSLDEHLVWYEGAGTSDRRYFIQDDLGSVVSIADGSGAALTVNSYDEYGLPAGSNSGLFGYTGQMHLSAAGLYHYRARAYSPSLGRFLQTDPIGMAGGMNLYAYVGNDSVNAFDPLGLDLVKPRDKPIVVVALPSRNYGNDLTLAEIDMLRGLQRGSVTPGGNGEPEDKQLVRRRQRNTLRFNVVAGGNGQCPVSIYWELARPSLLGGTIIQENYVTYTSPSGDITTRHIWETGPSWQVAPGSTRTQGYQYDIANGLTGYDDTFDFAAGVTGEFTVRSYATFYEGQGIPSSFAPGNSSNVGNLWSSTVPPNLSGGSNTVARSVTCTR